MKKLPSAAVAACAALPAMTIRFNPCPQEVA
jgi:hypothetical protein